MGGGVYVENRATFLGVSSTVDKNAARSLGGGAFVDSSTVSLFDVALTNNVIISTSSGARGSSVYLDCGAFQATDLAASGDAGEPFSAGGVACGSSCLAGKHANCEAVEGAPRCFANCGECQDCPAGKYLPTNGGTSAEACLPCGLISEKVSSAAGSTECDLCARGYFLKTATGGSPSCQDCPKGATCDGGSGTPRPNTGYWVSRKKEKFMDAIEPCPKQVVCKGSDESLCWTREQYTNTSGACDGDQLQCAKGSTRAPLWPTTCTRPRVKNVVDCDAALAKSALTIVLIGAIWGVVASATAAVAYLNRNKIVHY